MTREEITVMLVNEYQVRKSYLRTIGGLMEEAEKVGLKIIKNKQDYIFEELGAIKDFTKPVIIHREIDPNEVSYGGVPLSLCDPLESTHICWLPEYWMWFMNMQDGDIIHFGYWKDKRPIEVATDLDVLRNRGYLFETENNLEFYATKQEPEYSGCIPYLNKVYNLGLGFGFSADRKTPLLYVE